MTNNTFSTIEDGLVVKYLEDGRFELEWERGEMTKASWSPMHENLLIRVEDEIRRQFPNCPQWSPYGQFDAILKGLKELDQMTTANATKTIRLTDEQYSLLTDLFSSIADLDLQEHCDDSEEFDSLWDAVLDADD